MLKNVIKSMALALSCLSVQSATAADLISFWDTPQHGANVFNRMPATEKLYPDLKAYNATWVRLAYDKWESDHRDFLIGNADDYQGLVPQDLNVLINEVNKAGKAGLKVVITPLSLPFMRWSQNNGRRYDGRLFEHQNNWNKAIEFWVDLALKLKDNPYIAAYNIVNEPAPEKNAGLQEHASHQEMQTWYKINQGGSRDLPLFYEKVIDAIRKVDPATPIMVDAGWYAAADSFTYWNKALSDDKVLYSFHMYEPYQATSSYNLRRKKPYQYPGQVPFANKPKVMWNADKVSEYLHNPVSWSKAHGIPMNRLLAGEFGCVRKLNNCATYLDDVIKALDKNNLHWAFYSFREDEWDGMNYELGATKAVGWDYWKAQEKGEPDPIHYQSSPLFSVIQKKL
ncbi:glycoside hydrolase family 5 protein [Vibrio sp. Of14-4]|uniref:glycoside hydrolase family 5 protein n=1 Tax=Vibrio sp. Of14-4 TaxID=2724878 RepID=UPI001EF38C98|nr:cellulase family glycosylhydrolase [Vibrio sp. Of14-4]MCG7489192.1 glycoside hydrolase family 5 protein [Vibrio sp. Of14-4]